MVIWYHPTVPVSQPLSRHAWGRVLSPRPSTLWTPLLQHPAVDLDCLSSPKELTESTVNKMHVPQGQSAPSGPFHSWTSLESEELNSLDVFADFVWSRSVELGKEVHNVITMATIMTMTVIMTDLTNLANLSDLRPSIFLTLWQSYDIWHVTYDNWDL